MVYGLVMVYLFQPLHTQTVILAQLFRYCPLATNFSIYLFQFVPLFGTACLFCVSTFDSNRISWVRFHMHTWPVKRVLIFFIFHFPYIACQLTFPLIYQFFLWKNTSQIVCSRLYAFVKQEESIFSSTSLLVISFGNQNFKCRCKSDQMFNYTVWFETLRSVLIVQHFTPGNAE